MSKGTIAGTEFEKPRGVSGVEVREGYAQVHVQNLSEPVAGNRLDALKLVSNADISLDFLKLTHKGLSFLVPEALADTAQECLQQSGAEVSVACGRSIVLVHAVNIREEEGLLARLVSIAIGEGVPVEHVADMHDRMLLVTDDASARRLAAAYEREFLGARK